LNVFIRVDVVLVSDTNVMCRIHIQSEVSG